jgi:Uma2 family endonuclease
MGMAVETLISVEEYLNTSYEPDMEYVDGVLEERNVGDWLHSAVQYNVGFHLGRKYPDIKIRPELRSSVTPTRFRLPDVTVMLYNPGTKVLWEAAFLVIEVLSEADRMTRVIERLEDFAAKGVPHIWLFDPRLKKMSVYRAGDLHEVKEDVIATDNPRLELTRDEVFQD